MERFLQKGFWLCAFVLGALFLYASLTVFLADSELWALSSARFFWSNEGLSLSLHYKPLFYALLNLFHHWGALPDLMAFLARYLFALLGLGQAYLLFLLCQRIFKDTTASLLTVLILMSTTYFLTRGFRIRSDYLATTFFLASLVLLSSPNWKKNWYPKAGFGLSLFLMLAATPKAVYWLFPLAALALWNRKRDTRLLKPMVLIAGGTVALGALAVFLVPSLTKSYLMSLEWFLISFIHPDQPRYFSAESLKYLIRLFQDNFILSGVVLLNLYFCVFPPSWSAKLQSLRWATALVILPMLFHNHRTPFFLLSLLPPLLIFSGKDLKEILIRSPKRAVVVPVALSILITLTAARSFHVLSEGVSNGEQIKYIRDITPFLNELEQNGEYVLDVGGALLHPAAKPAYLGPSDDKAAHGFLVSLEHESPGWILDSYRLAQFGNEEIINYISDNYVRLPGGLWRRSKKITDFNTSSLLTPHDLVSQFQPQANENLHLVIQTSGPRDPLTLPKLGSDQLSFTYHSPLPLNFLSQIQGIRTFNAPVKVAVSSLPFPPSYPLESYSLFYFDTHR